MAYGSRPFALYIILYSVRYNYRKYHVGHNYNDNMRAPHGLPWRVLIRILNLVPFSNCSAKLIIIVT